MPHQVTRREDGPRRVRFWDATRLHVLLALRADPRGETAATLARRLEGQCARSAVYLAINNLIAEGLVTAGTADIETDLAAVDAMLNDQDPPERTFQLSDSGNAIADLLLMALRETMLRHAAQQKTQFGNWSKTIISEFVAARPQRAANMALRQGYPYDALPDATRDMIHRTVVLLRHVTHKPTAAGCA